MSIRPSRIFFSWSLGWLMFFCNLRFASPCVLMFVAFVIPANAQGWLTQNMEDLNNHEFILKSDAEPFFAIYEAMKDFYRGSIGFDEYREKLSEYADGGHKFSYTAKAELAKMDSLGRDHLERWSKEESTRMRRAAEDRGITITEFETLDFLFRKIGFDQDAASKDALKKSYGSGRYIRPEARSVYDKDIFSKSLFEIKKESSLKKLGFQPTESRADFRGKINEGAWFLYWQMIYDGSSRLTAEMARNDFIAEQQMIRGDFDKESMKRDLEEIRDNLKGIRGNY